MTIAPSHGPGSRTPVYTGDRRISGLYERTLVNGQSVFEARLRLGGQVRRHRLEARTKTDAVVELRALQTDYARGEEYRSPAGAVTVRELLDDFISHMRSRVNDPDAKRRRAGRTVEHYEYVINATCCPWSAPCPRLRCG